MARDKNKAHLVLENDVLSTVRQVRVSRRRLYKQKRPNEQTVPHKQMMHLLEVNRGGNALVDRLAFFLDFRHNAFECVLQKVF